MSDNTYAAAGVSIEEGDRAVELFAPHAKRATRPEVLGGLGGFAGLFKLGDYKEPILAAGSDGVGTKLAVAQAMDKHDTIGSTSSPCAWMTSLSAARSHSSCRTTSPWARSCRKR